LHAGLIIILLPKDQQLILYKEVVAVSVNLAADQVHYLEKQVVLVLLLAMLAIRDKEHTHVIAAMQATA